MKFKLNSTKKWTLFWILIKLLRSNKNKANRLMVEYLYGSAIKSLCLTWTQPVNKWLLTWSLLSLWIVAGSTKTNFLLSTPKIKIGQYSIFTSVIRATIGKFWLLWILLPQIEIHLCGTMPSIKTILMFSTLKAILSLSTAMIGLGLIWANHFTVTPYLIDYLISQ